MSEEIQAQITTNNNLFIKISETNRILSQISPAIKILVTTLDAMKNVFGEFVKKLSMTMDKHVKEMHKQVTKVWEKFGAGARGVAKKDQEMFNRIFRKIKQMIKETNKILHPKIAKIIGVFSKFGKKLSSKKVVAAGKALTDMFTSMVEAALTQKTMEAFSSVLEGMLYPLVLLNPLMTTLSGIMKESWAPTMEELVPLVVELTKVMQDGSEHIVLFLNPVLGLMNAVGGVTGALTLLVQVWYTFWDTMFAGWRDFFNLMTSGTSVTLSLSTSLTSVTDKMGIFTDSVKLLDTSMNVGGKGGSGGGGGGGFKLPKLKLPFKIPGLADGGVVPARPGGTLARVGEGGQDEIVAPLDILIGPLEGILMETMLTRQNSELMIRNSRRQQLRRF